MKFKEKKNRQVENIKNNVEINAKVRLIPLRYTNKDETIWWEKQWLLERKSY